MPRNKYDPLTNTNSLKILIAISNGYNYCNLISSKINEGDDLVLYNLKKMVEHKILPIPNKEKMLNKTIYTIDYNLIVYYLTKRAKINTNNRFIHDFANLLKQEFSNQNSDITLINIFKIFIFGYCIVKNNFVNEAQQFSDFLYNEYGDYMFENYTKYAIGLK